MPDGEPQIVFAATPGIRHVISGELSPQDAVATGVLHVVAGDTSLLDAFARTFHIERGR